MLQWNHQEVFAHEGIGWESVAPSVLDMFHAEFFKPKNETSGLQY